MPLFSNLCSFTEVCEAVCVSLAIGVGQRTDWIISNEVSDVMKVMDGPSLIDNLHVSHDAS